MKVKEQGRGFLRKKAGKLVSGIVLGTAVVFAGQVASADELKSIPEANSIAELLKQPDNTNVVAKKDDAVVAKKDDAVAKKGNPDVAEKVVPIKEEVKSPDNKVVPAKEEVKSPEQVKVDGQLNKIASDAKTKGVDVNFKGEVVVTPEKTAEALKSVENKVNTVVAQHSKEVEAYNKKLAEVRAENDRIRKENTATDNSNKNAKAVLTKDSTAKEVNGVYTQTLRGVSKTEKSANTTGTSKGAVSITAGTGVKLISAELLSPSGKKQALEVKGNKVDYNGILAEKGEYKVNYSFSASANQKDQVVGNFTVDSDIQDSATVDKKVNAPMDLIAMVDESPSYSTHSSTIFPLLKEMMKDANPKSRMAFYGTSVNEANSHVIKQGSATRWLSMEEANKFIDAVVNLMNQREREGWQDKYQNSWFLKAIENNPQFAVEEKYYGREIEDAHKDLPNKNKVFNIIQVTDGWSENEEMDKSFAEYAKAHAKTFVSVIHADPSRDFATRGMKQYGLDNAVNLSPIKDIAKIVSYFKQVAVETEVVKGTPKKESGKDGKTDKFEPTTAKTGKSLLAEPKAPVNAKVDVEKIKVVKPTPKPTPKPEVKKGSITQVFVEEGGKEIAPKTNTGEKPVDEAVELTHPNEIMFEGKTYVFTKQDKVDPTKIPNGSETITYTYKLKEEPKPAPTPVPTPKPEVCPVPEPVKSKPVLPKTGTEASMSLMLLGMGGLTLAGSLLKKEEK